MRRGDAVRAAALRRVRRAGLRFKVAVCMYALGHEGPIKVKADADMAFTRW